MGVKPEGRSGTPAGGAFTGQSRRKISSAVAIWLSGGGERPENGGQRLATSVVLGQLFLDALPPSSFLASQIASL
jgi:hypothetical protein